MTPIYFDDDKNLCDILWFFDGFCDILWSYPIRYRGGTHDNNGRRIINRRGGGSLTENAPGLHSKALAPRKNPRQKDNRAWRRMARQEISDRADDRGQSENLLEYLRKLKSLVFSVTALSAPIDWNPLSAESGSLLLHAYYSPGYARTQLYSRFATTRRGYDGCEVAGRDSFMLTTPNHISPIIRAALIGGQAGDLPLEPSSSTRETTPMCIECDEHPRTYSFFCSSCFDHLYKHQPGWAAAWYGLDWQEACQQWEREVRDGLH